MLLLDPAVTPSPKLWTLIVSAVLFPLLLLASLALALFAASSYVDSMSHDADRQWGLVGLPVAACLFLTAVTALVFLIVRRPLLWYTAIALTALALVGIVLVVLAG